MKDRPSLRTVLLVATAGVAVTAVGLTALLLFGLSRVGETQRAVREVGREADRLATFAAELPCRQGLLRPVDVQRELGRGAFFVPDTSVSPELSGTGGRAQVGGRDSVYAARETILCGTPGMLYLVRPFADVPPLPEGFGPRLLLAGSIAVGAAAVVAYLLARRMTRPLGELAGSARALARGEEHTLEPAAATEPAEMAELRGAFVGMADDLKDARDRERSFLLSVSHELRTPLTAIRAYGEALVDGTATAPSKAGGVVLREATRLERLVGDLIDLARLEAGEFSVHPSPTNLAEVARDVVDALAPAAADARVALELSAGETIVTTDPDRVHQMLANLIENALRVTPVDGTVHVTVGAGVVSVRDSGPGIAREDVEHAFERFYLWRRYQGERPVGTGLGLAIVGELAALLGVDVSVDAGPGQGARFDLRFDA